ncbi:hypothetical protein LF887_17160 [Chryseobacterium sp. MEBOG06]|nr:hypothetical protein LF887_17160 [Chryseobacterium sp. MEBOG06]
MLKYYRYSTQGQEKQEDTKWSSFKWRNYDPTFGRFFSIDPLSEKYAYQSHYNFSENRVVDGRELEGLEWFGVVTRVIPLIENSSVKPTIIETVTKVGEVGTKQSETITKAQQEHFNRGRRIETEQISKMNEEGKEVTKNTKNFEAIDSKTGKTGGTRPDGFTKEGNPVEVKNVGKQSFTKQLRLQDNLVEGKRLILRINEKATLTEPLKKSGIDIQTYNIAPIKVDNLKVNLPPPPQMNPIPVNKCAKDPNCV